MARTSSGTLALAGGRPGAGKGYSARRSYQKSPLAGLVPAIHALFARRVSEHRAGVVDGFTKRYGLKRLVYVEPYDDILAAT